MVKMLCDAAGTDCQWIIRPNQSLSWQITVRVYIAIAMCCLGIGIAFALHGYWPVLPFAGLEVAVLGAAFYLCHYRSQLREVVSIGPELVTVEKGRHQPQERWECPRLWARVVLSDHSIAWYPRRLAIAFQNRHVEIGQFLNEAERSALALELKRAIRQPQQVTHDH